MMSEQSFNTSGTLLASFDHESLCWRTSKASLLEEDPKSLERLPTSAMTVGGSLFEQATPVPLIDVRAGSAFPHLPTPVVNDMGDDKTLDWWHNWIEEKKRQHNNSNGHGKSLSIEVRLLPTPTARDWKDSGPNTNYERQAKKRILPGVIMHELSNDGNKHSDDPPHHQ